MKKGTCRYCNQEVFRRGNCNRGVNVRELVGGENMGWLTRIPCLKDHDTSVTCRYYTEPTYKDIKKTEEEFEELKQRIILTTPIINELKEKFGKSGGIDTVPCPVCGNDLYCSVSSYNGHASGQCETDGCLFWKE